MNMWNEWTITKDGIHPKSTSSYFIEYDRLKLDAGGENGDDLLGWLIHFSTKVDFNSVAFNSFIKAVMECRKLNGQKPTMEYYGVTGI